VHARFFHYPQYLEQTLAATTGKKFEAALNDTRMLEDLSAKPGVTIFAVQDSGFTGTPDEQLLKRHVHENLAYSPELSDGLCLDTQGGSILTVTHKGKDKFVNGAKIVRSNVITRNGVIHYLEKVCSLNFYLDCANNWCSLRTRGEMGGVR
jgi:hypothetical protein